MNEEDRKILEYFVSSYDFHYKHFKTRPTLLPREKEAMQNMLKENKELKEKIKQNYETIDSLEKDIGEYVLEKEKQDKMIDLMADDMDKGIGYYTASKEEMKELYRRKVEKC